MFKAEAVLHEVRDVFIGLGFDLDITVKLIDVSVTSIVDEEREGDIGVINKDSLEGVDSEETIIVAFTHGGNGEEWSCERSLHVNKFLFIFKDTPVLLLFQTI